MNEADAYSGRVKRAGRECVCVLDVMVVCVSVSVGVVVFVEEVDAVLSNEKRESEGCVREKSEMLEESKESVDDEQRLKREPLSEWAVLVVESGTNIVSEMVSEESKERDIMER